MTKKQVLLTTFINQVDWFIYSSCLLLNHTELSCSILKASRVAYLCSLLLGCMSILLKTSRALIIESSQFYLLIFMYAAAAAKSLQSCPTLWDATDGSLLGSSVSGILQARILEWVAISFSNAWKWKAKEKSVSRARLLATPWTAADQAPQSMGFSRRECWSGVPLPSHILLSIIDFMILFGYTDN